jgi:hypothetical protein
MMMTKKVNMMKEKTNKKEKKEECEISVKMIRRRKMSIDTFHEVFQSHFVTKILL